MNLILDVVGSPASEDLNFISDNKALEYIRSFPHRQPRDLLEYFPASSPDELDVLRRMLTFNPNKRITTDELLRHPYFESVKNPSLEANPPQVADFVFDRNHEIDLITLRQLFREEVAKISN